MFSGIAATGWLIGGAVLTHSVPPGIYRGLVQLAPNNNGECERFEYDNRTGWAGAKSSRPCDDPLPYRFGGRLHGIGDYFKQK